MDQGTLGAISTVLVTIAFIGVCWWAFAPKRKGRFRDDANLPFADDDEEQHKQNDQHHPDDDEAGRK
ncbi:cbb3-type cytochrome oxidase subunit 3 [Cellvibrio polysaccharolyticus]|uniref:Cbb3-type cytochrome c oxidase subunit 3 n=1 Tax=Cellvibrio polysaccharolyticus TaxID=2082724 RepID=A0A928V3Z2_9GAMM|nr:cbb3-type cytochrome c oxidase subunit 3 [Cellvibrio polysaccharolyticus]MBE8718336.1 cbb3-type cytochrome c oxidase subunit 3 [Cellvibrio polysaccharolyticus]